MIKKLKEVVLNPIGFAIALIFLIVSFLTTEDTISFKYDSDVCSGDVATLYYDYGDDFSESQSSYVAIDGNTVIFSLKNYKKIKQLRFVPFQKSGKTVQLVSCEIKTGIFKVKDLTTEQLIDDLTDSFRPYYRNEMISLERMDDGSDYLDFAGTLLRSEKYDYLRLMESFRKAFGHIVLILGGILVYWGAIIRK